MRITESWHRHAAYILFRVNGGKERIENIWPIQEEKKESEGFEISQEMYDLINTRYKTK
jgi:hypothetical protein